LATESLRTASLGIFIGARPTGQYSIITVSAMSIALALEYRGRTINATDVHLDVGIISQRGLNHFGVDIMRRLILEINRRAPAAADVVAAFDSFWRKGERL
jgi:hypothetical protein